MAIVEQDTAPVAAPPAGAQESTTLLDYERGKD